MPVVIDRFATSCPCLAVSADRSRLSPGESATLTVEFDPSEEPTFRGGLAVDYAGKAADGSMVVRGRVDLVVEGPSIAAEPPSPAGLGLREARR